MFGNWQALSLNISPFSFASPFFNGFAVSYDLCVYKKYKQLNNLKKESIDPRSVKIWSFRKIKKHVTYCDLLTSWECGLYFTSMF
ncbi:hypothetical protein BACCIP111895_01322 [Neobacillus rhizosphaerae]|uniref:Uncharacterized protein n=1 Tax=Neobacillus rhizosphaerae TaxID=2880965 RepID=A0ABM9EPV8_9BACI|nr:hypothetical protein BACCIP111895_01322 [Neobacillus rhizosphaerae]